MDRRMLVLILVALVIVPFAVVGCKGKVEKPAEVVTESADSAAMPETNFISKDQMIEPAETVATETIPPTAAPQIAEKKPASSQVAADRSKDIQTALSKAGFYNGAIDGKMGPKTKNGIIEFQKAKGLKADGKVGPKTWAELEKYLIQQ